MSLGQKKGKKKIRADILHKPRTKYCVGPIAGFKLHQSSLRRACEQHTHCCMNKLVCHFWQYWNPAQCNRQN